MSEKEFRGKVVKRIRDQGGLVIQYVGDVRQQDGTPDVFVSHWKWSGWIEFKSEEGRLSPKQRWVIRTMRERRTNAVVVREGTPHQVEDHSGRVLGTFATPGELWRVLRRDAAVLIIKPG